MLRNIFKLSSVISSRRVSVYISYRPTYVLRFRLQPSNNPYWSTTRIFHIKSSYLQRMHQSYLYGEGAEGGNECLFVFGNVQWGRQLGQRQQVLTQHATQTQHRLIKPRLTCNHTHKHMQWESVHYHFIIICRICHKG